MTVTRNADPDYLVESMKADYELALRDEMLEELHKEEVSLHVSLSGSSMGTFSNCLRESRKAAG